MKIQVNHIIEVGYLVQSNATISCFIRAKMQRTTSRTSADETFNVRGYTPIHSRCLATDIVDRRVRAASEASSLPRYRRPRVHDDFSHRLNHFEQGTNRQLGIDDRQVGARFAAAEFPDRTKLPASVSKYAVRPDSGVAHGSVVCGRWPTRPSTLRLGGFSSNYSSCMHCCILVFAQLRPGTPTKLRLQPLAKRTFY
jgi:hypothetical protein